MADACIHGFAPGSCLICQTLDTGKDEQDGSGAPRTATSRRKGPPTQPGGSMAVSPSGPRVVPQQAPAERSLQGLRLVAAAVAVVALIIVAWTALHVVFAVVHLLELIGVALLAGYVGWRAGVYHGRRTARRN